MLLRSTLLAALVAALAATPALAQEPTPTPAPPPTLAPLVKPCYVAAQPGQTEFVTISGQGFAKFEFVNIYVDDTAATGVGADPQAEVDGSLTGSVAAPFPDVDERVFSLRVAERENTVVTSNTVFSKVTRLAVTQTPARAATGTRVTFSGRGFTDFSRPVYMHYVFARKSRKTISLGRPTADCGLFKVKRKQFPFKKSPQVGVWTIQFDQERVYNPQATVRVPLTIRVKKAPKVKPRRARER